jgi:hypothetical protein
MALRTFLQMLICVGSSAAVAVAGWQRSAHRPLATGLSVRPQTALDGPFKPQTLTDSFRL